MEKILQILIVFALLVFAITWFIRGRERRYRDYSFSGRFTFPMSGDLQRELITGQMGTTALDEDNGLLFREGAAGKMLEIVDTVNGVVAGNIELEWNADIVLFDRFARLIYCCSVEGAVTIIRQSGQGIYKTVQRLAVPVDCTELSLDTYNGKLYVFTASAVFVYANV